VELSHGPPPERLDRVVERPHALYRSVREPLRERTLALVEALGGAAKVPIRVRLLLEDAQENFVGRPPCGTNYPLWRRQSRHLRSLLSSVEPTLIAGHGGTRRTPCGGRRPAAPRPARTSRRLPRALARRSGR